MLILSTTSDVQEITVIPRFEPSGDVVITFKSEQQNKVTHTITDSGSYLDGYYTISNAFDPVLKDKEFYLVEIKEGSDLVWRGRAFITDQTSLPKFTIAENVFTEPTQSNNEFIVLEE